MPGSGGRRRAVPGRSVPGLRARRVLFAALVGATTVAGTALMLRIVGGGGLGWLEIAIVALFAATFGWISIPFWTVVVGFVLHLLRRDPLSLEPLPAGAGTDAGDAPGLRTRTALVMPAFNEDPVAVLSRLRAVVRSLSRTGHGLRFDAFLLSDTMDPELAMEEEAAWSTLRGELGGSVLRMDPGEIEVSDESRGSPDAGGDTGAGLASLRAFRPGTCELGRFVYRRRTANTGRKAGNVWDFCRRWGGQYDHFVVLDADSLMSGRTLVGLVRAMEREPEAGLIQTVPVPARQKTLFGRILQFGAALQGPVLAAGQSFWQGETANYWGHNAIIRTEAFREHARLPVMSGSPPLGGEVLSHDFVEAAFLRRAGWKVYLDATLGGSYEGLPGDIPAYATRDRRWAQGSLQHLRLLGEPGLHPVSRLHFMFGAMGYVSSLLWLLMLLASTAYVVAAETGVGRGLATGMGMGSSPGSGGSLDPGWLDLLRFDAAGLPLVSLLAATALLLLLPKGLSALLALVRRPDRFGGRIALVLSATLEALFTVVLAPILMLLHSRFVTSIVMGRNVAWSAQDRDSADTSWESALRSGGWIMAVGVIWAGATYALSVTFFLWLTPIFLGLLLAVPMIRWTGSTAVGDWTRRRGLFRVVEDEIPGAREPGLLGRPGMTTGEAVPGENGSGGPGRALVEDGAERGGRLHRAERALFELRQGRPIRIEGDAGRPPDNDPGTFSEIVVAAVEGLEEETLSLFERMSDRDLRLVVTDSRARAMGVLPDEGELPRAPSGESPGESRGWSLSFTVPYGGGIDHLFELALAVRPAVGRIAGAVPATDGEIGALGVARVGRILPALVSARVGNGDRAARDAERMEGLVAVTRADLDALAGASGSEVRKIMEAPVPLEEAADARFIVFREIYGLQEHLAVVIGTPDRWPDPLPVRLHSACLTGDLFGSLRCDCGEQLRSSLKVFSERGGGVLLYLAQEGRGIGLINKLRAYSMQQDGLDTVDANRALGFDSDERRYDVAVEMLRTLGIERIQLLTNNPEKMRAMEAGGIRVMERMPLHGTLNRHNLPYVLAKHNRSGHWLESMLASGIADHEEDDHER